MTANSDGSALFGGLKAKDIDEISKKFICELCKLILLYPMQLLCCGTLLCKWCLQRGLSNSEPFVCQFCHTKQAKKEAMVDRGIDRELHMIVIVCYSCPWNGLYKKYLEHLQELHADYECTDCHERFFAINSFEEHRQEMCIHRDISCGLVGCATLVKWYDMQTHYLSDKHQEILLSFISQYVKGKSHQSDIHNRLEINRTELNSIEESSDIILGAQEILSNDIDRIKVEGSQIKTNLEGNSLKIEELRKEDNENGEALNTLLKIQNDTEKDVDNLRKIIETSEIRILDANSTITFRFDYSHNREMTSSFSSQFKTSEHGYTFMLRICPTIQSGQAYLSLFLTLFNAEHNNILPYPFSVNMYFILWDQSNQQKHIEYMLKPDPKSSSFVRPTTEKNDEYGRLKFCPMEYLTDRKSIYVKDEVFYIRIFMDFLNTGQNPFQPVNEIITSQSETTMITD